MIVPAATQRSNPAPLWFISLLGLNVLLHRRDPELPSKLPVSSGLTDMSLKSLAGKVSLYKTPFFIVQNTDILATYTT